MLTIAETEIFSRYVTDYWSEEERGEFAAWIAEHYDAGDVVRGSGGCRKVRWARKGTGKSGGVRVIYAKNEHENIPAHILKAVKEEIK